MEQELVIKSEQEILPISFWQAFLFWLKLGFISFGGPAGQIAVMHQELVEQKRWISEKRFLHALNYCMLLPGPEAQQLATYIGWLMHRTIGGIVAGVLFVLPSLFILIGLSWVYVKFGDVPIIAGLFYGIKPAVVAIVFHATYRIGSKSLKNKFLWVIAALAFLAIFFFNLPFPLIVLVTQVPSTHECVPLPFHRRGVRQGKQKKAIFRNYGMQTNIRSRLELEQRVNIMRCLKPKGKPTLSTASHSLMKMPNTIRVVITNQEYLGYFLSDHSGKPNESSAMFNRK